MSGVPLDVDASPEAAADTLSPQRPAVPASPLSGEARTLSGGTAALFGDTAPAKAAALLGADESPAPLVTQTPSAVSATTPVPFVPKDLKIESWADLKPYFDELLARPVATQAEMEQLILDYSRLSAVLSEAYAWAYINNSRYTDNADYKARFKLFLTDIMPEARPASNAIEKRIAKDPLFLALPAERYGQLQRILIRQLEVYSEKNEPLLKKIDALQDEYGDVVGGLTAEVDGQKLTIPQAKALTRSNDRETRRKAWLGIQEAYAAAKPRIDALYDEMIVLRNEVAANLGFADYRDYAHQARMRFDYTVADTHRFREAIKEVIVPLAKEIYADQAKRLGLQPGELRPWDAHWRDMAAAPGEEPLKPFQNADELLDKAIKVYDRLNPDYGDNLRKMRDAGLFDLASRPFKQPGGYNYPLSVTGMPFIFMNAAGTHSDLETKMHEDGHAMHTFSTAAEPLVWYQDTPAEMAETASMSAELITMPYWDEFYKDPGDLKRARREQLQKAILFLPWCAVVDEIQQWAYTNPGHTAAERDAKVKELMREYGLAEADWSGYEDYMLTDYLKQTHIFQMPFYYLEYGIAQLGSLQVYRNFANDPKAGLAGYQRGLSLGYSKPLPEIWAAMGIDFDFSEAKLRELAAFVQTQLAQVE